MPNAHACTDPHHHVHDAKAFVAAVEHACQERGLRLTPIRARVLQLIAEGCSNQEISNRLFISLHTVKTHASHINSKLGVERRTQAVARAQELRLIG